VFVETIDNFHAGRKVARRRYLLYLSIAFVFALTIYPSKAQAQIVEDLEVNIPFQFQAGNAKLPAGEYRVHVLEHSDLTVMEISSEDGFSSTLFQVREADAKAAPTKSELIFNKYGDRYFLAELFEEGSASGSQVVESRDEKTISQQAVQAQEHVPAYRRAQRGN
jgi:hypothetical protein